MTENLTSDSHDILLNFFYIVKDTVEHKDRRTGEGKILDEKEGLH